jgi:hypothetical protein
MAVKRPGWAGFAWWGRCGQRKCESCGGERYGSSDADINAGAFCFG